MKNVSSFCNRSTPDWIQGALLNGTVQFIKLKISSWWRCNGISWRTMWLKSLKLSKCVCRVGSNSKTYVNSVSLPEKLKISLRARSASNIWSQFRKNRLTVSIRPYEIGTMKFIIVDFTEAKRISRASCIRSFSNRKVVKYCLGGSFGLLSLTRRLNRPVSRIVKPRLFRHA